MNIVLLIQRRQLRGAELFACQLGSELLQRGHQVSIEVIFGGNEQLNFPGELNILNRPESFRLLDLKGWYALACRIKSLKTDVVIANAGDTLKYAVLSRFFFRWKSKLVFRNASMMSQYVRPGWHRVFNKWLLERTDYIFSVSDNSRADLIRFAPEMAAKSAVLPIGIKTDNGEKVYDRSGSPIIIQAGGFTFEKNQEGMLRIFSKVLEKIPDAELWFLGSGKLMESVRQQALLVNGVVRFLGRVSDIRPYLKQATVMALPSKIEGMPAVVMEAMDCACPVIAFSVGGIAGLIEDGENGVLIAPGDEQTFADRLTELIRDGNLRRAIAINGVKKAHASFGMDRAVDRIEKALESVIVQKPL